MKSCWSRSLLLAWIWACGGTSIAAPPQLDDGVVIVRQGPGNDVTPALHGPSVYLQGDGAPRVDAFQAQIDATAQGPVDVAVVSAAFTSADSDQTAECNTIGRLHHVHSCTTIIVARAGDADNAAAAAVVAQAEIVYFTGGNQCEYVRWSGTALHTAIRDLIARGGGVGGGSAGNAVQGQIVYDACSGSVDSPTALADPYHRDIHFSDDYLDSTFLKDFITDTHFVERNRMGRLMSFVARQFQDGVTGDAWGIGVDAGAGVVIDAQGRGTVYGGLAYVLNGDHAPALCVAGEPLSYSGFRVWKLTAGMQFDFLGRTTPGAYTVDVANGHIAGNPYQP